MRGIEIEAVDRGERRGIPGGPRHPRMQCVRPRHCLGEQIVHALDPIGEDFGDCSQHVSLCSQIRPVASERFARSRAASKRFSAPAAGTECCSRMFAQAMTSWSRARETTNCGGSFFTISEQRRHLRLLEQVRLILLDKINRAGGIARGQRMVDGLVEVAVFGKPRRRSAVELFDPIGPVTFEPTAQKLGEHLVEAEPIRVVVDPLEEQAALLDLFYHRLPVGNPRQHGCQSAARSAR